MYNKFTEFRHIQIQIDFDREEQSKLRAELSDFESMQALLSLTPISDAETQKEWNRLQVCVQVRLELIAELDRNIALKQQRIAALRYYD